MVDDGGSCTSCRRQGEREYLASKKNDSMRRAYVPYMLFRIFNSYHNEGDHEADKCSQSNTVVHSSFQSTKDAAKIGLSGPLICISSVRKTID